MQKNIFPVYSPHKFCHKLFLPHPATWRSILLQYSDKCSDSAPVKTDVNVYLPLAMVMRVENWMWVVIRGASGRLKDREREGKVAFSPYKRYICWCCLWLVTWNCVAFKIYHSTSSSSLVAFSICRISRQYVLVPLDPDEQGGRQQLCQGFINRESLPTTHEPHVLMLLYK